MAFSNSSNIVTARTARRVVLPPTGGTDLEAISFYQNFEDGYEGQNIREVERRMLNVRNGYIDTSTHFPGAGSRCMITQVDAGRDGAWGKWGFVIEDSGIFPRGMNQDTEVWFRCAMMFPEDFVNMSQPALKTLRIGKTPPSGANRGWNDCYMMRNQFKFSFTTEIPATGDPGWHEPRQTGLTQGRWHMLEIYWYHHHTAALLGGKGNMRFWLDGVMQTEYGGFGTLRDDGASAISRAVAHSIWNWYDGSHPSTPPLTQQNYYDQVAIAIKSPGIKDDEQYLDTDPQTGYKFIGMKVQ